MARLLMESDFKRDNTKLDASWYFVDTHYGYRIESTYPFFCAMHQDRLLKHGKDGNIFRIIVRKWIERHLDGDVVLSKKQMDYILYKKNYRWSEYTSNQEQINHGYCIFNFETEADLVHFRLRFSECIDEIVELHPDKLWMTEENGYSKTY